MSNPYVTPYGIGLLALTPTGTNPTPARIAILKEVKISQKIEFESLMGENMDPEDVAPKSRTTTGTAKCSSFASDVYAALMGVTSTATAEQPIADEAATIPASTSYTISVAQHSTWATNIGVIDVTAGIPMTRVAAASEAAGKYSVAAGVYTFSSADASHSVLISYTYTPASGGATVTVPMQKAGTGNVFTLDLFNVYASNTWGIRLLAVRTGGIDFTFGNQKHAEVDLSFQAFRDSTTGNLSKAFFLK